MPSFGERLKHAWDAFKTEDSAFHDYGPGLSYPPTRSNRRIFGGNDRSILNAIFNRMAADAAAVSVYHALVDENGRYVEEIDSDLNNVLKVEANIDQTGREFIQDLISTMLEKGCVAAVPTKTSIDPRYSTSYRIRAMRVAEVLEWFPEHVRVSMYNDKLGKKCEYTFPKRMVAIIQNPFYQTMNEPNSTFQRLARKLTLMDIVDERTSSGKLDMIIQLPYPLKSEARMRQAEERRQKLEEQLSSSKYGIGYIDSTEKITQVNRTLTNNLLDQIDYLTTMLYGQLGITPEVLNGTADEQTMLNYYNRAIEPILSAVTDEFKRKFLTKTARTQGQSIVFIRDPFRLAPINNIADIADRFSRNAILSTNEIRGIIGFKPSDDPTADALMNKNLYNDVPMGEVDEFGNPIEPEIAEEEMLDENQNGM